MIDSNGCSMIDETALKNMAAAGVNIKTVVGWLVLR